MKFTRFLLLLALPLYFISCKPLQKIPNYLENVNDSTGKGVVKVVELKIQKNDLLSIQIFSLSTQPDKADILFNQPTLGAAGGAPGYLVDNNGNIEHHRLGVIHAEGLTKQQLADEVKKRLKEPVEVLADPTVLVRFMNLKVTVLGMVGQEGPISVPGEKLNIFEAVGLAGGINDFGKKNTVKVIRETDGQREVGFLDLTSQKVFESPYYNLVQNDLVIVEATSQKQTEQQQTKIMQKITFAFTIVTAVAALSNIFIRN
ncbi:MAG TPA: polysaccharide biosynthesis/export family protein [Chitinophagaceae bacterium]|nr:polysaccharide biosynthesis/export family protein [Chitinophagaceae bacterium]